MDSFPLNVILSVVPALASLAGIFLFRIFRRFRIHPLIGEIQPKTYSERLLKLTRQLTSASDDVDGILREMASVTQQRQKSIEHLEAALTDLETREKELKDKIALLQNVPIPVAEHFAKLIAPGEKRSARRDYILFFTGVVVTTVIGIALQLGFWLF